MISTIRSSVALASLLLAACATQPPRPVELPLPARPTVPAVKAAELQCLSDGVYTRITNRERGYKNWGLQLEAIIQSNNAKATAIVPTH
jgi:hypothetical protein